MFLLLHSNTKRLDTSVLAALVQALEQDTFNDQRKTVRPQDRDRFSSRVPSEAPKNRYTFNLPTEGKNIIA